MRCRKFVLLFAILAICSAAAAQEPKRANADATYQQLRQIGLSGEAVSVSNFELKREGGTFTFKNGVFFFVAAVAGKVTGAVFTGEGEFSLAPLAAMERRQLQFLTREAAMREQFHSLVLRFTDNTAAQIKAAGTAAQGSGGAGNLLGESQDAARKKLRYNLDARLLQDVLSDKPGGLFVAFIHGSKYDSKELFEIDPHGCPMVAPEEVSFLTYDENKYGIWAAYHLVNEYASGRATGTQVNAALDIAHQKLDTRIEKSGYLRGKADTTFIALADGLRVVPFNLFPTLRVQQVTSSDGQQLAFVQEKKEEDADFWVILPKALAAGETYTLQTVYEGKDAVSNQGGGNYFPVARHNWYPSTSFGDYAEYEMTFATPKGLKMIATGMLVKEYTEGDQVITQWKSEAPQAVAGFNFGDFKSEEAKVEKYGYVVQSYANRNPPDSVQMLMHSVENAPTTPGPTLRGVPTGPPEAVLGNMSTTTMIKKPLSEAQVAMELYTNFFGPSSYKHIAMTQQTACNFGQSWPELVYLPICAYFDDTVKHQLLGYDIRGYWRVVAPHEVAHQWWGHTVGFNSYRDQWMSEGFADFSASLFIQLVWNKPQEFLKFWKDERELITEKNKEGFRAIDAGPITMGYRLDTTRTGAIARRLIYPKGAYILHMIRMMMWDTRKGDEKFRALMTDFVKTYANRTASTEDFKAMLEKHITPAMDLTGDGRMDWFFSEYVYGTALPKYQLESSFSRAGDGIKLKFKAQQSEVDDNFSMLIPLYLELADGKIMRLGQLNLKGNSSVEREVQLPLKDVPKRAMLNYYGDVLASD